MITPIRIRVRNIRSVRHGEITIPDTGITALHGPVGSGKSTFLSAMVWALYGEVPGGLKQADMRRSGADGEPCEAEVDFIFNGQRYTALRGLRQRNHRGGVREEAYARWWTNGATGPGQDEPQISPSKLTMKIYELTGLTGRAYCGAFFIAQGELTGLAEGTPAQVQQLFEEQTGLGDLTKKVDIANAEARRAEELAAAMPGSREETDEARRALDEAQQQAAEAHETHEELAETARQAADRMRIAEKQAQEVQQRHRLAEQERINRARADERVQQCQQRVASLTGELRKAGLASPTPEVLTQQLDVLRDAVHSAERAVEQIDAAEKHAAAIDGRVRQTRAEADRLADPELDRRIESAKQQHTEYEQRRGALKGEYTRLSRALQALTTAESACCPTCVQPLRNVGALVADLRGQWERCIRDGKNAKAKAEAAVQLHDALLSRRQELTQLSTRLDAVHAEAIAARQQAETARRAADEAVSAVVVHLPGFDGPANPERALQAGRAAIEQLSTELVQARHTHGLRTQLTNAESELEAARADLAARETTHPDVTANELAEAAGTLTAARAEHNQAAAEASEANTRFLVAAERVTVLTKAHEVAEARMRAKADKLHTAHILHVAAAAFAQFRRDLLAEYTAAVSQAATDVLTQITDRHVRFEIDDAFVPRVHTAEGTVRPTRVLSGGEKATAALAFRLGITEQITGGNAIGMIIADEITAAHDADTRRAVLTCLSELGWPALVVSHGEEITEVAQQVISLSQPDENTGTMIASAA
ncbi:AAA family ATPase [Streptomyces sp. NPDC088745]|uniref:AAA family ATPase n=1 Tax=Streptomyces sp. NPDC088745 TaxID=3365884 RepID=UPI003814721A